MPPLSPGKSEMVSSDNNSAQIIQTEIFDSRTKYDTKWSSNLDWILSRLVNYFQYRELLTNFKVAR